MDYGALLVVAAIALLTGAYLAQPMLRHQGFVVSDVGHRRSELRAAHEQVLSILQELDLDYAMGKLAEEDYRAQRAHLLARGAEILRQLDALSSPGQQGKAPRGDVEARIEALVAQRRGRAVFCPQCGVKLVPGDRFCSACGAPVAKEEE